MPRDDKPPNGLTREQTGSANVSNDLEELRTGRAHPDPRADLGYEATDWERISTADASDQLVFLPAEEEMLLRDAFLIVPESDLCDLSTMQ